MAKSKKNQTSAKNVVERRDSDASTISELPDKENTQDNEQVAFSSRSIENAKTVKKPRSLAKKSGLVLPVFQILKTMKKGHYADKIQKGKHLYNSYILIKLKKFFDYQALEFT